MVKIEDLFPEIDFPISIEDMQKLIPKIKKRRRELKKKKAEQKRKKKGKRKYEQSAQWYRGEIIEETPDYFGDIFDELFVAKFGGRRTKKKGRK